MSNYCKQLTNRSTGCFSKVFFMSYFALDEALRVGLFDNSTYKTNDSIILYFMNDEKLLYFSSYSVLNGCTINLNGCFWLHVLRKGEQPLSISLMYQRSKEYFESCKWLLLRLFLILAFYCDFLWSSSFKWNPDNENSEEIVNRFNDSWRPVTVARIAQCNSQEAGGTPCQINLKYFPLPWYGIIKHKRENGFGSRPCRSEAQDKEIRSSCRYLDGTSVH